MRRDIVQFVSGFLVALLVCLAAPNPARAQDLPQDPASAQSGPNPADNPSGDDTPTIFPHSESSRFWVSGQANFISEWHPAFSSPYRGPNSLSPEAQDATSRVLTLFTGFQINSTTELLCDVQETGGHGIGEALGLAGFTNLDVVRNPLLSKAPYVARLMWHQIIPLSHKNSAAERTPFSLFKELPERRLEIRFGKFSIVDFFDVNTYGTDSNFQFMNWTVDNNGAYDYAADTRGYTFAAMVEYDDRHWAVRFAEGIDAQGGQRHPSGRGSWACSLGECRIRAAWHGAATSRGSTATAGLLERGQHGDLSAWPSANFLNCAGRAARRRRILPPTRSRPRPSTDLASTSSSR